MRAHSRMTSRCDVAHSGRGNLQRNLQLKKLPSAKEALGTVAMNIMNNRQLLLPWHSIHDTFCVLSLSLSCIR